MLAQLSHIKDQNNFSLNAYKYITFLKSVKFFKKFDIEADIYFTINLNVEDYPISLPSHTAIADWT